MREVADSFRANESMIFVIVRTNYPIIVNEKEIVTEKENIILIPNEKFDLPVVTGRLIDW